MYVYTYIYIYIYIYVYTERPNGRCRRPGPCRFRTRIRYRPRYRPRDRPHDRSHDRSRDRIDYTRAIVQRLFAGQLTASLFASVRFAFSSLSDRFAVDRLSRTRLRRAFWASRASFQRCFFSFFWKLNLLIVSSETAFFRNCSTSWR